MIEDDIFDKACDAVDASAHRLCDAADWTFESLMCVVILVTMIPFGILCGLSRTIRLGAIKAWRFIKRWLNSDDVFGQ